MTEDQFDIKYLDSGRLPQCDPNPAFPDGMDIPIPPSVATGSPSCKAVFPYPFPHVGALVVECKVCGCRVAVTVAGRPDDARSMEVPCKAKQTH